MAFSIRIAHKIRWQPSTSFCLQSLVSSLYSIEICGVCKMTASFSALLRLLMGGFGGSILGINFFLHYVTASSEGNQVQKWNFYRRTKELILFKKYIPLPRPHSIIPPRSAHVDTLYPSNKPFPKNCFV
uniref:Uncharacterized protein n=1 Tax=Cacopsylla melanoneura TaxID=428564 RepID=A0A8D9AAL1_9HEMI